MNLPNKLTVLRVILIPFFVVFLLLSPGNDLFKWISLAIFIIASLTDMLDGKIARKYNLITDFGKFMDPLADKLLVCSAMICLIDLGKIPSWVVVIIIAREFIRVEFYSPASFLMSDDFLDTLTELCKEKYPYIAFADIFYTIRSMLIPVLHILQSEVPKANIYHTVCTGYGGLLAALANYVTGKKVILTEHGIYSREREEEIIRARWVVPEFKRHWIRFFYMLSDAIYGRAENITCLFQNASKIQIELGAPPESRILL